MFDNNSLLKGMICLKKILSVIFVIITLVLTCFNVNAKSDVVRIHIRANSNSEGDQQVKLLVRDEINEFLAPLLVQAKTKSEAESIIKENIPRLEEIARSTAKCNVSVELKQEYFPEKTYNQRVYPEGEYTALIISIGSGQGRNWWCVAFPAMCYTTSKENKPQYKWFFVEFLERIGVL